MRKHTISNKENGKQTKYNTQLSYLFLVWYDYLSLTINPQKEILILKDNTDCFVKDIPTLLLSLFFLSCVCSDRRKQLNYFIMEPGEFIAGKTKVRRPLSCISAYLAPCLQQIRLRAIDPRQNVFESWQVVVKITPYGDHHIRS